MKLCPPIRQLCYSRRPTMTKQETAAAMTVDPLAETLQGSQFDGKHIGLALGGGGARGIAHIPVLEAMDELGIRPSVIAGSSIGAIIGAGYASGMNGREIRSYAISTFADRRSVLQRLWKLRPASLDSVFQGFVRFGELDIERVLEAFLPHTLPERIEQLAIPLKIVVADFYAQKQVALETGSLRLALAASAAIPVLFRPVMIEGTVYVDGGFANPVPFDLLTDSPDPVVAVDVVGMPTGEPGRVPSRVSVGFGASQLLMQSITSAKLAVNSPDLLFRPDTNKYRVLDFLHAEQILEDLQPFKDEVKRAFAKLLDVPRRI